jgi:hypothetical protein
LDKFQPRVILFEHKHLSDEDRRASGEFLGSRYVLHDLGEDIFAVKRETVAALKPRLRRLEGLRVKAH